MSLFKLTQNEAHFLCPCGATIVREVSTLKVGHGAIPFGVCESCGRGVGAIVAGDVPEDDPSIETHRMTQTLAMRLNDADQIEDEANGGPKAGEKVPASLMKVGRAWVDGETIELPKPKPKPKKVDTEG